MMQCNLPRTAAYKAAQEATARASADDGLMWFKMDV